MTESNYINIELEAKSDADEREPFKFILDGRKFEIPMLGPDTVPAGLFSVAAREYSTDVDKVGNFLIELFEWRPDLGRILKRLPIPYAIAFIDQWTKASNVDPKAQTSSS